MPAPIAPWMSASEALTIWILSTAMKAPSVAPTTPIQVLSGTVCSGAAVSAFAGIFAAGAGIGRARFAVAVEAEAIDPDMAHLLAAYQRRICPRRMRRPSSGDNLEKAERIIPPEWKMRAPVGPDPR